MANETGQADAVPSVTEEMIDAGEFVHTQWEFGGPRHPSVRDIVKEIFEAMAGAAKSSCR